MTGRTFTFAQSDPLTLLSNDDLICEVARRGLWPPIAKNEVLTINESNHSLTIYADQALLRWDDVLYRIYPRILQAIYVLARNYPKPMFLSKIYASIEPPCYYRGSGRNTLSAERTDANRLMPTLLRAKFNGGQHGSAWNLNLAPVEPYPYVNPPRKIFWVEESPTALGPAKILRSRSR